MATPSTTRAAKQAAPPKPVAAVLNSYSQPVRKRLLELRELVLATAAETPGVGPIEETLKWGQPSFVTTKTRSGSTVRMAATKPDSPFDYALFFICNTNLVDGFKDLFGDTLDYEGNRALLFSVDAAVPTDEVRECIAMALTYHLTKSARA